ncbi:class I SAM-dependent methyltransferase [Neisseria weaveri]|uniref:class I SAM-dependent methyltransferase n=1 Tax=Neisseria weaveri TaxID=28091 RepID=UPI000D2F98BE|nr:methyltransferase domain-containing protein [Neisseria weaveri]
MMSEYIFSNWFKNTDAGKYIAKKERLFFQQHLSFNKSSDIIQVGFKQLPIYEHSKEILAIQDITTLSKEHYCHAIDVLILPHTIEYIDSTEAFLKTAYQVLKPDGQIILTAFNPFSLWFVLKKLHQHPLPEKSRCFSLPHLKKIIYDTDFIIDSGQFMVYVPPLNHHSDFEKWRFMESAGNRWWPHGAAVYGLILKKNILGMHLTGKVKYSSTAETHMTPSVAHSHIQQTNLYD